MFDDIGVDRDDEAGRRRAAAGLLTALTVAALGGAAAGLGALLAGAPRPETVLVAQVVDYVEPPPAPELPDAPPAAPGGGGGPSAEAAAPAPAPPDAPPDEPPPLAAAVPTTLAPPAPPGTGAGPGTGPGTGTGSGTGTGTGTGGGGDGGGTRVVHASELEVKRRVEPRYPEAALGLALGEQSCVARVHVGADGVPDRVAVSGCPAIFHPATERALLGWRWWPYREAGGRTDVITTVAVRYVPR